MNRINRFVVIGAFVTIVTSLTFARQSPSHASGACARTEFQTVTIKNACAAGGQASAKDAMKAFMKKAKLKDCKACHSNLAPTYELKPDGLATYKKAGGT